jgi:hypothetical protein
MTYTYDEMSLSDLHKDAYGFRPSAEFFKVWDYMSSQEKQEYWDSLLETVEQGIEQDRRMSALSVTKFKEALSKVMEVAGSEETALRWLTAEEDFRYSLDIEHWLYMNDILDTEYGRELQTTLMKMYGFSK